MNRIMLMGRITRDAEQKATTSGTTITSFSVAVERPGANKETDFIPVIAFGKTGDMVKTYFPKGRMIALEGRLQVRRYEDKDGKKRTASEVIADRIYFCGDKQNGGTAQKPESEPTLDDFKELDGGENPLPF